MKKAFIVFLLIFFTVSVSIPISNAQSKKQVIDVDTVKTKVLEAKDIYADKIKLKTSQKLPSKYEESQAVRINFKKRKLYKLPDLGEGDFYHLQIDDINMNLYTVSHQSEDSVITTDITFPTFDIPGLETLGGLLEKLPKANLPLVNYPENLKGLSNADKIQLPGITQTLNKYVTELNSEKIDIQKLAHEIDTLMLDVRTLALSYLVERDKTWQEELKGELDFKTFFEESEKYRNKVYALLTKLKKKRTDYLAYYDDNKEIISKNSELRKTDENIKEAFTAAINHLDKTFQTINADKVSEWLTTIIHLDNNKTQSYTSLPIQLKGDFTDLSIDIKPKDEKFGLPSYHTNLRFPDAPEWRIGVSSGFYWSYSLSDDAYSVNASVSSMDTTKADITIVDEELANWETGITTMFHYRIGKKDAKSQFNFSIGPAVSLTKLVRPRLVVGFGTAFGRKHKITLNAIGIAGQVDRLSNNYSLSETKQVPVDQIPETVTVSKIKTGFGLSLGYLYNF